MTELTKIAAVGLLGMILTVTVRQRSAELALLTGLAVSVTMLGAMLGWIGQIAAFWDDLVRAMALPQQTGQTLLRTVGIALLTQLSAQLCRDGGEGAIAAKLELAGSCACIVLMLPQLASILLLVTDLL